ncbi:MAG TPA: YajQ family cyclic di-GMP-binding protein [Gammaproteobacteria bacterium]|jgi:uncharacterized protein YajQ (UPF0234 family)
MPSFDIVSEVDLHELSNAVDQANKEVSTRFDFKGVNAGFKLDDSGIMMECESKFQLGQMKDILYGKCSKRGVDLGSLLPGDINEQAKRATQKIQIQQGIETEVARKIVKRIKQDKLKVQAAIQGDQVRVTGKKRDDLQAVIAMLKSEDMGLPLQFSNFRD